MYERTLTETMKESSKRLSEYPRVAYVIHEPKYKEYYKVFYLNEIKYHTLKLEEICELMSYRKHF